MKKSNLVIIGTLAAALLLSGCEQEPKEPSAAEKAAAALAASADFAGNATVSGATVTLTEDVTLTGDIAVAAGVTLNVADKTLTVPAAMKLDVAGQLDVAGTINIAGTGVMNIENGGTYILQGGTENHAREAGTNNGTVYIKSGGVTHGKGGVVDGDGLNVVEVGGTALYTSANGQTAKTMIDGTNSVEGAIFKFTTGTLSFNNWDYILDGNGTLASNFLLYSFRHQKLTVKQGSTLTIASGANLIGQADSSPPANTTQVVNNGTITFMGTDNSNFYPSSGTTAENPAANTTYKWSATAGGQNKPGWKAEASG